MPGTSGIFHDRYWGAILFNVFISDLDDGTQCTLNKFADTPNGRAAIQRNIDKLSKWTDRNLIKFSKGKYKVLHLGKNNPMRQDRLWVDWLESNFTKKDLGFLVDNKFV
ncbi:hypothetical protein GRJ2_000955600 [Grus japonensis]|uniref:Rna-directed dna polymerase from mobile element jockey-like n=1 Tax=Grus japonensis TaxID=30415 RepID=A0ABC9WHH0_GRUJA